MSSTPFGDLPATGAARNSASETGLLLVSGRVKSGACWLTFGALCDSGRFLGSIRVATTKNPKMAKLRVVRIAAPIFERLGRVRSGARARRTPTPKSTAARPKSKKLAHGKSRVTGNHMNTKK